MSDAWMVIQTIFSNVRWLPVFGVSILATVIGVLWHLPFLFRKIRAKETDGEGGARKINKPAVIALSLLLYFIVFTNLSIVVAGTGAISALLTSLQISIVWLATALDHLPACGTLLAVAGSGFRSVCRSFRTWRVSTGYLLAAEVINESFP